ncbi:S46 family peptidase [Portibacter lacus]|nr:S46 family peptidase [Portibacter lacus]
MKFIKLQIITFLFLFANPLLFAGEGMWLPLLLKSLNEAEMQSLGMKMTAEDIYSVNQGSLKDAIVHFGGFCTSELISNEGLLLTNHHCGYGAIQSHTSLENNFLKEGFWAKSKAEEKPNPGLFAKFIVRIEDVTDQVLKGAKDKMNEKELQSLTDKNIDAIRKSTKLEKHEELEIKPFFKGNQYFMFVTMTYTDVRLVGAPPESIGKFGADTDNWEWPRHTGDFSLFRIYAGPDNMPAEYSENNIPYQPKHFLPISLDGVAEGDFTLIFGFPGRTDQYLPAVAIEQTVDVLNPAKIGIRDKALKIIGAKMRADESVKIKYSSKFASTANYWKKWIGESQGLVATNAVMKKRDQEADFQDKIYKKRKLKKKYGMLLGEFETAYKDIEKLAYSRDYYSEVVGRNIEIFRIQGLLSRLLNIYQENGEAGYENYKRRLIPYFENFYKNYDANIDEEVFAALLEMYVENVDNEYIPPTIFNYAMGYDEIAQELYSKTLFKNSEKLMALLSLPAAEAAEQLKEDPIMQLGEEWKELYDEKVATPYNIKKDKINALQKQYMAALIEAYPDKTFWPDANSTMRVTYGQVAGYHPKDAVYYLPVSYLEGVMEKYKPGDYEFDVSAKLIDLFKEKDYGQYADQSGKVPVCFLGTNHTTGGNSGSPAIDAHGNLVGLNFDRVWEGTMSDLNYDKSICRNIMVDIRYVLFIVDKYAGASHLIEEMKLVHPKK